MSDDKPSDEIATLRTELDAEMKLHLKAAAERDELRAENERLRADAERLDWLDDQGCDVQLVDATSDPQDGRVWIVDGYPVTGDTLRAAIDAARKGEQ